MPSFLQFTALPFDTLAETLFLAGTTLGDQTETGFRISGNGYDWSFSGRGLTFDSDGNVSGGLIDGWSLRQGAADGTPGIMTASTNFNTLTPAILTAALALHAGGDAAAAVELVRSTWDGEYLSYTTWAGGSFTGTEQGDGISMGGAPSTVRGAGGSDTIQLSAWDDRAYGGSDADWLYGQSGSDLLIGDDGDDHLYGGTEDDRLRGDQGNDVLDGGSGNDILRGGEGADALWGRAGMDRITGDDGDDSVSGGAGEDAIAGGTGNDAIFGNQDGDALHGNDGDDTLTGGTGLDTMRGGSGSDTLYGGTDEDGLRGDQGNDRLFGGAAGDLLSGGSGDDLLSGQTGDDTLWGNSGTDRLLDGSGSDVIYGGAGADTFVISRGAADDDMIGDFRDGFDRIDLRAHDLADEAAVLALAVEDGGHVILTLAAGQILTILNTTTAALAGDLIL